jgi:hypothetical protein
MTRGITMTRAKVGRNEPCPCGSGKKFKHCCESSVRGSARGSRFWLLAVAALVGAGLLIALNSARNADEARAGRVWSPEHGHWHDVNTRER